MPTDPKDNVISISEWKNQKSSSSVGFELLPGENASQVKTLAKEAREWRMYHWKVARRNQSRLAEMSKSKKGPDFERKTAIEHNTAAWQSEMRHDKERAFLASKELKVYKDLRGNPAPAPMIISEGRQANQRIADLRNRNNRTSNSFLLSPTAQISRADVEELRPVITRAKGAMLPPPHPNSLGERAKHSTKAKRDAWRASKAGNRMAGIAPTVTLEHRAKGWDKIKAIEPGELPDTD